jgi:hypothetical protein
MKGRISFKKGVVFVQTNQLQRNFMSTIGGIFFFLSAIALVIPLFGPALDGEDIAMD